MIRSYLTLVAIILMVRSIAQTPDARMNAYINSLMSKMTVEEKIGQLNLLTPGWGVPTGSVVSKGVEDKIRKGQVGGLFGVTGPDKVRAAQYRALHYFLFLANTLGR